MVVADLDDVLGFGDLSSEWDELKEKYKSLEWENFVAEKDLAELWVKAELANSLQEEVDQYSFSLTLVAQLISLKTSLAEGEERWMKASEGPVEMCCAFEMDQKVL